MKVRYFVDVVRNIDVEMWNELTPQMQKKIASIDSVVGHRLYSYYGDSESVKVGDYVIVPFGKTRIRAALVCALDNQPKNPTVKYKDIIGHASFQEEN